MYTRKCKPKFWSYIFYKGFQMSDFRFLVTNGKLWSKKLNCYKERKFTFAKKMFGSIAGEQLGQRGGDTSHFGSARVFMQQFYLKNNIFLSVPEFQGPYSQSKKKGLISTLIYSTVHRSFDQKLCNVYMFLKMLFNFHSEALELYYLLLRNM